MSYVIFTDTSANLATETARKLGVHIVPLSYFVDGVECICSDTAKFDAQEYYKKLAEGMEVTTSQVTPQRFIDNFSPVLREGKDILFISISSGVSGTYNSAVQAAKQLKEEFPERRVEVFDTLAASLGQGMFAVEAAKSIRNGQTLDQTLEYLENLRSRVYQVFTVDDLMYLKRGGRLSGISAGIGTVLNIKPILKGNSKGQIVAFSKVRGRKKSIEALADRYEKLVENQAVQTVYIAHCACKNDAEQLAEAIQKRKPPKNFMIMDYEPVIGSYVGLGAIALFFISHDGCRFE